MTDAKQIALEDIEIDLLLQGIFLRYGYDFRDYSRASLERRIRHIMHSHQLKHISEMLPLVLHDRSFLDAFLKGVSVTVTEMFRDPEYFLAFREKVIPYLKTFAFSKVWQAGCATGEEAYSLAILLHEEGLAGRVQIYATDFNMHSLEIAREGIYPLKQMRNFTKNYNRTKPRGSLSDYYHARYDAVKMNESLSDQIVFSSHNLATDSSFGEMNAIICRNVLIYFDRVLQRRVFDLFDGSLSNDGFICLGAKETPSEYCGAQKLVEIAQGSRIYQRETRVRHD
jgi:chemotaxis protein methyltransferase CheR